MGDKDGNTFLRYVVAVVAVSAAVLLRLLLDPLLHERLPLITLFAAVAFMAWYGGRGPAVLALALGLAAVTFFVMGPRYSFVLAHQEDGVGLLFYAVISAGCIALFEQLRGARRRAEEPPPRPCCGSVGSRRSSDSGRRPKPQSSRSGSDCR